MSENSEINAEELIEHHGGFIFPNQGSSNGIDEDGQEYDHSFITQDGRVSYNQNEDGTYIVFLTKFESQSDEKRILSFDQLKDWFYTPTSKYYQEIIVPIELQS